jgi:hypothetical protein
MKDNVVLTLCVALIFEHPRWAKIVFQVPALYNINCVDVLLYRTKKQSVLSTMKIEYLFVEFRRNQGINKTAISW